MNETLECPFIKKIVEIEKNTDASFDVMTTDIGNISNDITEMRYFIDDLKDRMKKVETWFNGHIDFHRKEDEKK